MNTKKLISMLVIIIGIFISINAVNGILKNIDTTYAETTEKSFLDIVTMRQYEGSTKYTRMYDTKYNIVCYGVSEFDKIPYGVSCVQLEDTNE